MAVEVARRAIPGHVQAFLQGTRSRPAVAEALPRPCSGSGIGIALIAVI